MNHLYLEIFGYIGSALVLISFLMASVVKLRIINMCGSAISFIYALISHTYPIALMNICLVAINLYYLMKLRKNDKNFSIVHCKEDDSFIDYLMNAYKDDIKIYFSQISMDQVNDAYLVCVDTLPAGILIGNVENGVMNIEMDYSIPAYRDCSVATFLYSKLKGFGIHQLIFAKDYDTHKAFLRNMGYIKENNQYVKTLD